MTDPDARLPDFMAHVNKLVSKCINASLGRWESLWSPEHYSAVALETEDDVLDKMGYVLTNPLEAGLVESWSHWPGLISGPRACASPPVKVERPDVFFRADGVTPEAVMLSATVPPCFGELTPHRFAARLAASLRQRELEIRERLGAEGRRVLGREAVRTQDPFECPASFDPRRRLNPKVACKDKWRRIEALQRVKEFLDAYREAWQDFKTGIKDVVFPAGTYWMCRHGGLPSASPG